MAHAAERVMKVSLTMIVKNEQANLEACLTPVRDLFDEIVIVDTGSTDTTREIAEALGARVIDYPWCDDFSAARNAAIDQATGDWIFWLDADDRVSPADVGKLRALFAGLRDDLAGWLMGCVCMTADGGMGVVEQVRLFRRDPRVRWIYRVHEQIADSIVDAHGELRKTSVRILHTGYIHVGHEQEKAARNLRLVRMDCAERPTDPYPMHHFGAMLVEEGQFAEGARVLERVLPLLPPSSAAARKAHLLHAKALRNGARMTVSLAMIVKNEAANLEGAIGPLRELVDEIVVVDTGSTDETRLVAERLGARVFEFPWCDSFAAARNAAIERASSDWIFILDADDRIAPSEAEKLRRLFATLGDENVGWIMGHVCLGADGVVVTEADQVRLFRRREDIRWEYRVHEQIAPSISRANGFFRHAGVRIIHTGFRKGEIVDSKIQRNLRLVEMDCADHPLDPFPMFYRGTMLADLGRSAEAIVTLNMCKTLSSPASNIGMQLAMMLARAYKDEGDFDAALEEIRAGRARFPDNPTLACHEAELLIHRGDIEAAGACLLPLIDATHGDLTAHDLRVRTLLAEVWLALGRHEAAENLARELVRVRPSYGVSWLLLADAGADLRTILNSLAAMPGAEVITEMIERAREENRELFRARPPWSIPSSKSPPKRQRPEPVRWELGPIRLTERGGV
jgi:glycosyltransferase involved in cell wall biosynthesis